MARSSTTEAAVGRVAPRGELQRAHPRAGRRAAGPGARARRAARAEAAGGDAAGALASAPFVPAEAREDLLALKSRTVFVCTRLDGDIVPGRASGEGFYAADTRHLSELRLAIGGCAPVLLSSAMQSGRRAVVDATNPWFRDGDRGSVPQDTLNIRRTILVGEHLLYEISLRSFHAQRVRTTLALSLAADFADVFEVRGYERRMRGEVRAPRWDGERVCFAYEGEDGAVRQTRVCFTPSPADVAVEGQRAGASWEIELAPGDLVAIEAVVDTGGGQLRKPRANSSRSVSRRRAGLRAGQPTFAELAAGRLEREDRRWARRGSQISSDNELFGRVIDASVRDIRALMMPAPGGELPAAGIPWYVAPFGRDAAITALQTLLFNPEIARGTLLALARMQSTQDDPFRDAEPGKLPHELRVGELARLRKVPHSPYYGTVDATPLYVLLAAHYYDWTGDLKTMRAIRPALDAALAWIDDWGDRDGDGFVEYQRRSPAGLRNQGWKDSEDAVVHPDGSLAEGPVALVEVQAYVYAAWRGIAGVYRALGQAERARALAARAKQLRARFNDAFWDAEQRFFALALDGRKRQVRTVTSNPAHCLYCGIVDDERAEPVARRLMAPDMFSGWGVRTLSSAMRAYNPMSYHNGSVWPHDNAIAAAGLMRYGFHEAAERVASALFEIATGARDYRLPELVCGFDREGARHPVSYPVACSPQAWAAAAPFMLMQALMGIDARAPQATLVVNRPHLPAWITSLDIRGLRVGDMRASLSFRRTAAGHTGFALLEQDRGLKVSLSASAE